jgi:hypothetical protein
MPDSRDLETKEREKKEGKEMMMVVAATNKELHFDWIMHSPNDRHSTGSFYSLVDGRYQKLKEYLADFLNEIIDTYIIF